MTYEIREVGEEGLTEALELVWSVFCQYEGTVKGVNAFRGYLNPASFLRQIKLGKRIVWGCYCENRLLGVLALNCPNHIALLYVLSSYHHQGIGYTLYQKAAAWSLKEYANCITVNASRQGGGFYEQLGFRETGKEQWVNGIAFTPMKRPLESTNSTLSPVRSVLSNI